MGSATEERNMCMRATALKWIEATKPGVTTLEESLETVLVVAGQAWNRAQEVVQSDGFEFVDVDDARPSPAKSNPYEPEAPEVPGFDGVWWDATKNADVPPTREPLREFQDVKLPAFMGEGKATFGEWMKLANPVEPGCQYVKDFRWMAEQDLMKNPKYAERNKEQAARAKRALQYLLAQKEGGFPW